MFWTAGLETLAISLASVISSVVTFCFHLGYFMIWLLEEKMEKIFGYEDGFPFCAF